jgi:hypothetical protein
VAVAVALVPLRATAVLVLAQVRLVRVVLPIPAIALALAVALVALVLLLLAQVLALVLALQGVSPLYAWGNTQLLKHAEQIQNKYNTIIRKQNKYITNAKHYGTYTEICATNTETYRNMRK